MENVMKTRLVPCCDTTLTTELPAVDRPIYAPNSSRKPQALRLQVGKARASSQAELVLTTLLLCATAYLVAVVTGML